MSSEVFEFRWRVPQAGFHWIDGRPASRKMSDQDRFGPPGERRFLTHYFITNGEDRWREYDPLREHPALFRTFADLPPTEEAAAAFAASYGPLGVEEPADASPPDAPEQLFEIRGESWTQWMWQLAWMKEAVALWDAIKTGVEESLEPFIRWGRYDLGGLAVRCHRLLQLPRGVPRPPRRLTATPLIASADMYPDWLDRFPPGKLHLPARAYLCRLVDVRLRGAASLRLLMDIHSGDEVLRCVPHTLIGCMWLQLAEARVARREQYQCSQCGLWFEAKPQGRRDEERRFCGAACRNRAYRERQQRAAAMKAGGKTPQQIADELGSNPDTVNGWIKASKKTKVSKKKER